MENEQLDPFCNDLEVEITDLGGDDPSSPPEMKRPSRSPLAPRFSPRQRRLQLTVTTGIVLLALFLLLSSIAPLRNFIPALRPVTPTPTATPDPRKAPISFMVDGNPSWGSLTVDGKPVPPLPQNGMDGPFPTLAPGHHTLVWTAQPFPTQTCTVTVPLDPSHDTCQREQGFFFQKNHPVVIFRFDASIATLPDAFRTSLIQATQALLDTQQSTETVQIGEHFGFPYPCSAPVDELLCVKKGVAATPVQATLRFQLLTATAAGQCRNVSTGATIHCPYISDGNQNCYQFCSSGYFYASTASVSAWEVAVVVQNVWQYSTPNGQILTPEQLKSQLPDSEPGIVRAAHITGLNISWDGTNWHVSSIPLNQGGNAANCGPVQERIDSDPLLLSASSQGFSWVFLSGNNAAAGCVVVAMQYPDPNHLATPTPGTPVASAYCFYRFNVLLAGNAAAHQHWPTLPVTTHAEQQQAEQIIALYRVSYGIP